MTLLAWPALLLLASAGVLLALATLGAGPRRRDVGTLMIWKRVAEKRAASRQRKHSYDLLLWLSISAVLVGALAAARPGLLRAEDTPRIAVFIEANGPGNAQEGLDAVMARAETEAGGELTFFMPDAPAGSITLTGGPIHAQLAQFENASRDFDARMLFLNAPAPHAETLGKVLPRVTTPREGVVYDVRTREDRLVVERTDGEPLQVEGATLLDHIENGRESTWLFGIEDEHVTVSLRGEDSLTLQRRPFVVGIGSQWSSPAHAALYDALGATESAGDDVQVWLGSVDRSPAIRPTQGQPMNLSGAELSFDPQHPLFRDIPLREFDWLASGRAMALDPDAKALLRVVVDGEPVGDLVRIRGDLLEFAGDPFTEAPVASAALLLDNAVGVLTGERPSERERYELVGGVELPSRRAALAAPFDPVGELDSATRGTAEPLEFSTWLMLIAGLAAIGAGYLVSRNKTPGLRRGL